MRIEFCIVQDSVLLFIKIPVSKGHAKNNSVISGKII